VINTLFFLCLYLFSFFKTFFFLYFNFKEIILAQIYILNIIKKKKNGNKKNNIKKKKKKKKKKK